MRLSTTSGIDTSFLTGEISTVQHTPSLPQEPTLYCRGKSQSRMVIFKRSNKTYSSRYSRRLCQLQNSRSEHSSSTGTWCSCCSYPWACHQWNSKNSWCWIERWWKHDPCWFGLRLHLTNWLDCKRDAKGCCGPNCGEYSERSWYSACRDGGCVCPAHSVHLILIIYLILANYWWSYSF